MHLRILGSAAGGAFPQWNCNCENCRLARKSPEQAHARSQSSVALSADGRRWFLINASPDIRLQIEAFAPLLPGSNDVRGTGIEGILLTNADLDHTLGLLILREGRRLSVHATPSVQSALNNGLNIESVLACYSGLDWHDPPSDLAPLPCADGSPSGLRYAAIKFPGKPPRYREGYAEPTDGDCVGYRFEDETTGGRVFVIPDVAAIGDSTWAELADCDALLLDGTFWSDDEMQKQGVGDATAARMGHLPISGPDGSLARMAALPISHKIYIHLNNTNPILLEHSAQRTEVEAAGVTIGWDGLELIL